MKRELRGDMVFDTSVFVEFFSGSRRGELIYRSLKKGEIFALTTELNIFELLYLLCRKVGLEKSKELIAKLKESGCLEVFEVSRLVERAAAIKCERAISLVDCLTLALGEEMEVPVVFAVKELELMREIGRKPFKVPMIFLEDLIKSQI